MKNNIFFFGALLLVAMVVFACNRKNGKQAQAENPVTTTTDPPVPPALPAVEPGQKAYQVAGFQKTPCFGKCPSYQVKFFSDGKVTWYGRLNVERMGDYVANVTPEVLKGIQNKAEAVNYWDFQREYPTERKVADLPSTITYLRKGDMEKQVSNTHDAPAALKDFEKYLEDIINGLVWRPVNKE